MSEHMEGQSGYSLHEKMARTNDKLCITCLKKNTPLVNLGSCEHADILVNLLEIKMFQLNNVICHWCHNILKKINDFKLQAMDSYTVLNNGLRDTANNYPQNLELSKIELQSTINSQPIEFKTTDHTVKKEIIEFGHKIEIKIEPLNFSEQESYLPLVEIAKKIKSNKNSHLVGNIVTQSNATTDLSAQKKQPQSIVKTDRLQIKKQQPQSSVKTDKSQSKKQRQGKKKTEKSTKPQMKKPREVNGMCYDDKITIIVLSEKEMLDERKMDGLTRRYLKLPYKCEKCITSFNHELMLDEHNEKKHKKAKGSFVCNICESVFNKKLSFEEHYKRHYRRYECIECKRRFNNVFPALKHYKESHGNVDMNFKCKLCDFTTESYRSLRYHRDKHLRDKVECEQCGNTFVDANGLRVHMLNVHKLSNRIYSCDPCGKVYNNIQSLNAHIRLTHKQTSAPYCVTCDLSFRTEAGLKHHLKHTAAHVSEDAKKFSCTECDTKFTTKRQLQEHVDWVHRNCTTHTCSKCSKIFKNEKNMKRHILFVHDKVRPPRNKICDHCGRGFTSTQTLISHIRTHTGERPFNCTHCAATFAHSAALYTHNKLLHKR
ncbi:zinc finger protein 16-like [Bicyclus anynana]|uniref:Zinc finger protein 16-like n=1 Tax=Bicyclus anynana TaxID=110368 RepID=A0ABM3M4D7_BICAN|nr:zinc finger protein 16-like [Bicyclus anynana]